MQLADSDEDSYKAENTFYFKHRGQYHIKQDSSHQAVQQSLDTAARLIIEADAVIILAGAGMGVDMGLADFRSSKQFWVELAHPHILKYEHASNNAWFEKDPALAWGLNYGQLSSYRGAPIHDGYIILKLLAECKDTYCYTSNVDGVFKRAGFDPERVVETHGNIHRLQCTLGTDCPAKQLPWGARVELPYNPKTCRVTCPVEEMPRCPGCDALARPNLWFCTDRCYQYDARSDCSAAYMAWAESLEPVDATTDQDEDSDEGARTGVGGGGCGKPNQSKKVPQKAASATPNKPARRLVTIECGAGMVIPSCRVEAEDRAGYCEGSLIRINPVDYGVPKDGEAGAPKQSVGIPMGSAEALRQIAHRIPFLAGWREKGC